MPTTLVIAVVSALQLLSPAASSQPAGNENPRPLVGDWPAEHTVCRPLSLRAVKLGGFLGRHVDANNRQSLPAGLETVIPKAIEARARGEEPPAACKRLAGDSDFYKWLEGAAYAVAYDASLHDLAAEVDRHADMLIRLQEPSGYLGTRISPAQPFDEHVRHDLYVCGHFIEAAVAHYAATGNRKLLDAAERYADFYLRAMQAHHPYFKLLNGEHPEIEPALVRLARATGEPRFADFSAAMMQAAGWGSHLADMHAGGSKLHAVRLCYLLGGACEFDMQTGNDRFYRNVPSLWDEIVTTRMYVTGGIGYNEVIPPQAYDLPSTVNMRPDRDIAETCASVSFMMLSWRMHAITGESRIFDTIETILYNHYLGALSADHQAVFYYNPLERIGDLAGRSDHGGNPVQRTHMPAVHSTSCCMPNAWRFFAQLPEYVFSTHEDGVSVNLYTDADARYTLADGTHVHLRMQTQFPHDGRVAIQLTPDTPTQTSLYLRIPAWCEQARVRINDEPATAAKPGTYQRIERLWQGSEQVVLDLPMTPKVVFGDPQVQANRGKVALRRGPLIYCLEKQDAAGLELDNIAVAIDQQQPTRSISEAFDQNLGLYVLKTRANDTQNASSTREVQFVPFYFRANRSPDSRWITWLHDSPAAR